MLHGTALGHPAGLAVLWHAVNPLTMWLTLATFVGCAIVYTVILTAVTLPPFVSGMSGLFYLGATLMIDHYLPLEIL